MGGRKAGFDTNRSEFVAENALDGDIEYRRTGGCFVTTKKAVALVVIAILALVIISALIYFYGNRGNRNQDDGSSDIEKLLNDSLSNDGEDFRLPPYVRPLHYRLRIHPYLDEPSSDNFTFTGRVTIVIQSSQLTSKIILNTKDLHIFPNEVSVVTTKSLRLRSLSQIMDDPAKANLTKENFVPPIESPLPILREVNNATTQQPQMQETTTHFLKNASTSNSSSVELNVTMAADNNIPTTQTPPLFRLSTTNASNLNRTSKDYLEDALSTMKPAYKEENKPPQNSNSTATVISSTTTSTTISAVTTTTTTTTMKSILSSPVDHNIDSVHKVSKVIHLAIKKQEEDERLSKYTIHLSNSLQPGVNYTLDIKFSGRILNNLVGLYKTNYLDVEGRKRWLLTTQFQPIYARRAFPCFDEPSFRSEFEISVARRTHMFVLSNMPLKESEPVVNQTGWVWDHFERSPLMAPHTVAFTVCDYENLKPNVTDAGPLLRVWAPREYLYTAQYAADIGPKILSYLQNYFGVNYPLAKIDLVTVPELSRVATENWGLISFRDTAMLLDNNSVSWETQNSIFKTLTNKLTKQWFGNMMTINWWSELWLNEGFSTYMEDVVENAIEPALEDLDTFALRVTQAILNSDKLKSARSLDIDVKDPTQIEQLFDDVTTNKGSCLIRMLNYTLGENLFKEGVQNYFKKCKYKGSNQNEFWKAVSEVVSDKKVIPDNVSLNVIMDSWIEQEGYPLVNVIRDYATGNAVINQTRFVYGNATYENLWYIPLTYTKQNEESFVSTLWLKREKSLAVINFTAPGNNTWVLFNIEQSGFYRVNYDDTNWKLLQKQLMNDPGKILPSNRAQLLNDAFELANVGILNYRIPFELAQYLKSTERNYVPWYSFYNSLQTLEHLIDRTPYYGILQQYVVNIIKPLYGELGTSEVIGESRNFKLLRRFALKMACKNNYEPCIEWAKQKYQEWMASPDPDRNNPYILNVKQNNQKITISCRIPFEFREIVQCSAIKRGGRKEWDFLWQRSLNSSVSSVNLKTNYLSLGCTHEPWLINSYLEKTINGSIAVQNVPYVWRSIAHSIGLSVGFTFLRTNWDRIYANSGHIFTNFKSIFEDFLSKLSTEIDLEDLTIFYKNHEETLHPVTSLMLNVVNRIKLRIMWTQSHMKLVVRLLMQNK